MGFGEAPFYLRFSSDLVTPVRAFLALTRPREDAFILESVAGGESQARYSFVGLEPSEIFGAGGTVEVGSWGETRRLDAHPLDALGRWISSSRPPEDPPPVPFLGGAVGWIDFSSFSFAEPTLEKSFGAPRDPRMIFGLFSTGLVLDHLRQEGYIYRFRRPGESDGSCLAHLEELLRRLEGGVPVPPSGGGWVQEEGPDRARFERNIASVQASILAGDAYQVVISEPFSGSYGGDPFDVYRRLRRLNPSPYHFYVSLGGRQVVGASPEMLVRIEGGKVTTVPIAGTRRRGDTAAEDAALERELLADPKELAEHAMLVDLARNDLGRVCAYGSVSVPVRGAVERYSHVMHMTSEVQGELSKGKTQMDALASVFPAGTVSGAPKIRAAQIISELEGADRGVYGGAVGILDAGGGIETCIAIRTIEFEGGRASFRAGAGIVADSTSDGEWEEIHRKAGVLLAALGGDGDGRAEFGHRSTLTAQRRDAK